MPPSICIAYEDHEQVISQWDYSILNFAPECIYVCGRGSNDDLPGNVMRNACYINSADDLPVGHILVLLSPRNARFIPGTTPLADFVHPENAVYFFGGNDANVSASDFPGRQPDYSIYVATDSDDNMYSWMTWAVVAYDRKVKGG